MKYILTVLLAVPMLLQASPFQVPVQINDAWVRQAPAGAVVMVAYARISNASDESYWIKAASSPAFESIQLHETVDDNGIARMLNLKSVELSARTTVEFAPGGRHFMLFNPRWTLAAGERIDFELLLGNGQRQPFSAVVRHRAEP